MAVRTRGTGGRALPAWVRVRPRDVDPTAVHFQVVEPAAVTAPGVRAACASLADVGVRRVVTNAMTPAEAAPFRDAGFRVRSELDLLARPLDELPPRAGATRRARNRAAVVALDQLAFESDEFDGAALDAALRATTVARFRIAGSPPSPLGYAITGAAGRRGYVQRLAVHPDARRRGIAAALLLDGLRWARRRGARDAVVNTDRENRAARSLYETHGFVDLPTGLVVLERAL
jgi:ribosomal-protein-alanine N-acetyltransferase